MENGARVTCNGITPVQQMVSSCTGAILTSLLVTPLDVVKTRLQSQKQPVPKQTCMIYYNGLMDHICPLHHKGNGQQIPQSTKTLHFKTSSGGLHTLECTCPPAEGCLKNGAGAAARHNMKQWYQHPAQFNGTMDAFIKISRHEGIRSLWSGLPPTMVMAVPATVVYFTMYDQLKYWMGYREMDPSTQHIPMLAGVTSRFGAVTMISPLELVRTKMQSERLSYRQVGVAIRHSIQEGGVLSLWRGLAPTLFRDIPFSAMYWFGYEYFKVQFMKRSQCTEPTFYQTFASGALSGSIAAVVTIPFDVVKTQRQIELGEKLVDKTKECHSTWCIIKKLYKEQGVKSLFRGLVPRVIKVAPACAIMISTYEFSKQFFRHYNHKKQST